MTRTKTLRHIVFLLALLPAALRAQNRTVSGTVLDAGSEEAICGAVIQAVHTVRPAESEHAMTDANGNFSFTTDADSLIVSFLGYADIIIPVGKGSNLGYVRLTAESRTLEDAVITGQVAVNRHTPVAASTVHSLEIQEKLGNQEFPEVLRYTPGVYVSRQGGGWGDSEIYMRGFDNTNIAIMVDGIAMNDMLDVTCYWSNWAALSDVASVIQTQRGIGASKVSAPSVGGTINIRTKGIDTERGGNVQFGLGNDGYNKLLFTVSSGLTEKGWAFTILGSRSSGNGYVQGADFTVWSYFTNISKRINADHQLSLTAFGAPQQHHMRSYALTRSEWEKAATLYTVPKHWTRYNPEYGFGKSGERKSQDYNQYHKPQITLNHTWSISPVSNLSTTAYVSFGRGYGIYGTADEVDYSEYDWYPSDYGILNTQFRCADGTFDYGKIQDMNATSSTGSKMVLNRQSGNHNWYGLVSTFTDRFGKLDIQAGIDLRYYHGFHRTAIEDLMDGEYYIDPSRKDVRPENNASAADPSWVNAHLGIGDVVSRNYDSHIMQEGIFGQMEYSWDKVNVFAAGSLNYSTYWKYDRLYYDAGHARSGNAGFWGGTAKAGANWNIDRHNNVFANVGFTSKAPVFKGGVFMSATSSNVINDNAKNEKSATAEIGYGFHNSIVSANVNAYYTEWIDKSMRKKGKLTEQYYINMTGVNSRHIGIEADVKVRPARWVELSAMASVGDWRWDSDNVRGYAYNIYGQAIRPDGTVTVPGADDHAWAVINMKGIHVGGSAQTTAAVDATFTPFEGFRIGGGYTFYNRNYAYYALSGSDLSLGKELYVNEPWRIPASGIMDLRASYRFSITHGIKATLSGIVNNVIGSYNIEKAWNPVTASSSVTEVNPDDVYLFYSPGRTWTINLKFEF